MVKKRTEGFTLLEILLVLFLMMTMVLMAAPRFDTARNYTVKHTDAANRRRIEGAAELYRMDTGMVPERVEDLVLPPPGIKGWRGPYLEQVLVKPNGEETSDYKLDYSGKVIP